MKMNLWPLLSLLVSLVGVSAQAKQLNLVCETKLGTGPYELRTLLVSEGREFETIRKSSQDSRIVRSKNYVVVIELIPGHGNDMAKEEWYVLTEGQFSLVQTEAEMWELEILKPEKVYTCFINGEMRASPALTRSN